MIYCRQKRKIVIYNEHIANARKDFLHKQSRQITNVYDCVSVENLDMRAMARALNFAKSVNDNARDMFMKYLDYKLFEQGKTD